MARISFVVLRKLLHQTKAYQNFWDGAKIKLQNRLNRNSRIQLLICPVTYSGSILWYSWLLFHSFCWNFANCMNREGRLNIVSMFSFLETDTREQKKYEKRIQSSVDNTVNDLRYKIKFQSCDRQKYILFLETYFF